MKSIRNAALVITFGSLASFSAQAKSTVPTTIDLFEEVQADSTQARTVFTEFQIDSDSPGSQRAWISVTTQDSRLNREDVGELHKLNRNVPGLSFDPNGKTILFEQAGKAPIICATVVEHTFLFFHSNQVEPTGSCILNTNQEVARVDDGFHVKDRRILKVSLSFKQGGNQTSESDQREIASDHPASPAKQKKKEARVQESNRWSDRR